MAKNHSKPPFARSLLASRCLVQLRDDSDQTNATPVEVEVDAVTLAMDLPSKCLAKEQDATIVAYHG